MADILVNHLQPFDRENIHMGQTFLCLRQAGLFNKMLELSERIQGNDSEVQLMRHDAFDNLNDIPQALNAFEKYLDAILLVGDIEAHNILHFCDFLIGRKLDAFEFYERKLSSLKYQDTNMRSLIHVYAIRFDENRREVAKRESMALVTAYANLDTDSRVFLLDVLFNVGELQTVIDLIEAHHNWKVDPKPLLLYTRAHVILKKDSGKLIEVLKFRRDHYPEERLLLRELEIYVDANHDAEVLAISQLGRRRYPNNVDFRFYYIQSLVRTKDPSLRDELTDDLQKVPFRWQQKFVLANFCLALGKRELGLEIAYQETIANYASAKIKDAYFHLLAEAKQEDGDELTVSEGNFVRITHDGKHSVVQIDALAIAENPIVKKILGAKTGETVAYDDPVIRNRTNILVGKVFGKYNGLFAKITEEASQSGIASGMNMRSFEYEGDDPAEISKALVNLLGGSAAEDSIRRNAVFQEYYERRASFSELLAATARTEALSLYSLLTSNQSKGFLVLPLSAHKDVQFDRQAEFVLDVTALPILKLFFTENANLPVPKFVISQFLMEYLERELVDTRNMDPQQMTVRVVGDRVIPHVLLPGYKEHQVAQIEGLVQWVKASCKVIIPEQRVQLSVQKPELFRSDDSLRNMAVDTTLLAIGRVLVSDDLIQSRGFKHVHTTLSVEFFCKSMFPDQFESVILPMLLRNHYIGITIGKENLLAEYRKPKINAYSTFSYCLECLPFSYHWDTSVFFECADFVKEIYSDQTLVEARKKTAQDVFTAVLKDIPKPELMYPRFRKYIEMQFQLLQYYLPSVLDDFDVACQIIDQ